MTVLNITRKDLKTATDNDVDKIGNKIKLKSTSLTNTRNNIMNIPIISSEKDEEKEEIIDKTDNGYTLNASIIDFETIKEGNSKPINVKEKMLDGIKKHSKEIFNLVEEQKIEESLVDELSIEENNEIDQMIVPESGETPIIDTNKDVEIEINSEQTNIINSTIKEAPVEQKEDSFDINKEFNDITLTRKEVENIRLTANQAAKDAEKSDEDLKKSFDENNSIETQLKDAEVRSIEIEKELIEALKKQSNTLNANREKYNKIILESNNRREQNETKIIELQNKTAVASDKLSKYQNDIDSKEQILKALLDLEENFQDEEVVVKKVA